MQGEVKGLSEHRAEIECNVWNGDGVVVDSGGGITKKTNKNGTGGKYGTRKSIEF